MDNKTGVFSKYHTDEFGNPISIQIVEEERQVSPTLNVIQLNEIPDEYHRLTVKNENDEILHEVFDIEQLTNKSYKVNYSSGVVHFSKDNKGKTFKVSYYGRGVEMINSNRVGIADNEFGHKTIQDIVDENIKALHTTEVIKDVFYEAEVGRNVAETDRRQAEEQRVVDFLQSQTDRQNTFNQTQTEKQTTFDNKMGEFQVKYDGLEEEYGTTLHESKLALNEVKNHAVMSEGFWDERIEIEEPELIVGIQELREKTNILTGSLKQTDEKLSTNIEYLQSDIEHQEQSILSLNSRASSLENDVRITNDFLKTHNGVRVFVSNYSELKKTIENHNGIKCMEVIMLSGDYLFDSRIVIKSNTKIKAQARAVCRWNNNTVNDTTFFLSQQSEAIGDYDSTCNIEFDGLEFNGENLTSNFCFIALGHCSDITIKKCVFTGFNNAWHCLEVNSTKCANICENLFYDNNLTVEGTELIQIDNAHDSSRFPWGGLYDATPCCDINIINNTFLNSNSICIGTHSYTQGKKHKDISVKDNKAKSVNTFIYTIAYERCTITNNHVEDTSVFLTSGSGLDPNDKFKVSHNVFDGNNKEINGVGHFIRTLTTDSSHCNDWVVTNNNVYNVAQTAISVTGTRLVINGNSVVSSGWSAIHLYGCRASVVDGNILSDSKYRGGQTVYGDLTLGENPAIKNANNIITNNYISMMCARSDDDSIFMGNLMLASRSAYQMTRGKSNYIGSTYWESGIK